MNKDICAIDTSTKNGISSHYRGIKVCKPGIQYQKMRVAGTASFPAQKQQQRKLAIAELIVAMFVATWSILSK